MVEYFMLLFYLSLLHSSRGSYIPVDAHKSALAGKVYKKIISSAKVRELKNS